MIRIKSVLYLCVIFILSGPGCTKVEIEDHSYQFNEATGSLTQKLILLNAVRASKDYPMQFSKIATYQGVGSASGSLTAKIPFGPDALKLFEATPSVSMKSGISQLNLADLNTEEAQNSLKRQLTENQFRYYYNLNESRSLSVVLRVFFDSVRIHRDLYPVMMSEIRKICGNPSKIQGKNCKALQIINEECGSEIQPIEVPLYTEVYLHFSSRFDNACSYRQLTALSYVLLNLGFNVMPDRDGVAKKGNNKSTLAGGNTFNFEIKTGESSSGTSAVNYKFYFLSKEVREHATALKQKGKEPFEIVFRSPESMVRYLGQLIAVQNYGTSRFIPDVYDVRTGSRFNLFVVKRGRPFVGQAAVQVRDQDGDTFFIPKPDYDAPDRDRSLEVLSIVSDVFNGAVSKKAFPEVSTFTLSPSP